MHPMTQVVAVVPVRDGVVPAGGAEAVLDAGGRALLVGSGLDRAATELAGVATELRAAELGEWAPGRWARALAPDLVDETVVVLPGSPDGRDLAPRLAAELERPLHAPAMELELSDGADLDGRVALIRHGGRVLAEQLIAAPCVVTLQPGVRGVVRSDAAVPGLQAVAAEPGDGPTSVPDPHVVEVLAPDVTTMDLSEAPRILGGGAGLADAGRFELLARVAEALGASMGATRVITDRGWIHHDRQIGTTGVVVDPHLYVAFGISGAVQHTAGLGDPDHVVSVNTDPHCPMMELADLAVVADANATLAHLAALLGLVDPPPEGDDDGPTGVVGSGRAGRHEVTLDA